MKLSFYKHKGNWFDWLVRFFTRGPYSHVELVFDQTIDNNFCLSSSPRDGGVRVKRISNIYDNNRWDIVDISMTPLEEGIVYSRLSSELGKKYDWFGVLGFFLKIKSEKNKWFCSEICAFGLNQIRDMLIVFRPESIHPNKLYKLVKNYLN